MVVSLTLDGGLMMITKPHHLVIVECVLLNQQHLEHLNADLNENLLIVAIFVSRLIPNHYLTLVNQGNTLYLKEGLDLVLEGMGLVGIYTKIVSAK